MNLGVVLASIGTRSDVSKRNGKY